MRDERKGLVGERKEKQRSEKQLEAQAAPVSSASDPPL
jgi:hypothetical protein